jgi:LacI family transcriptional regulator
VYVTGVIKKILIDMSSVTYPAVVRIVCGREDDAMSTMREVAERAGVSAKTVSRVMNDDRYVSADVRRRVELAIAELKYVPNLLARTFRAGRDAAIGVAIPDIADPFFAILTREVEQIARPRGVAVFITSLGQDGEEEQSRVEALLGRQLTGLITTPVSADQSYLRPWQERTTIVFIDRPPSRITADSVLEDDESGAYEATRHLIGHGHRRVAFVGDRVTTTTTARRLQGYRAAMAEAGIPEDPRLVAVGHTTADDCGRAVIGLMHLDEPPTAVFSSNAWCTIGVIPALQSAGRRDMPLISFGDFPLAGAIQPPPSVLDQDPVAVGRVAATRLFERIDHPSRRLKRKIVLPVPLVLRGSCCPIPDTVAPVPQTTAASR